MKPYAYEVYIYYHTYFTICTQEYLMNCSKQFMIRKKFEPYECHSVSHRYSVVTAAVGFTLVNIVSHSSQIDEKRVHV